MEVITVEAVSDKFKNKYNSGSVLANGKWMQVSSKLNLSDFQKDSQIAVETKTNDKGYVSIVDIVKDETGTQKQVSILKDVPTNSSGSTIVPKYTDSREEGQREGNRRNVAATITNGLTLANSLTEDAAFETYQRIHQKLVDLDSNG